MSLLADLVRHDLPLAVGATAVYPYRAALERQYRFRSRFGDEVLLHAVEGKEIHLPRALCPIGGKDERVDGEAVAFPKCPPPRPDQVAWFEATAKFLEQGLSGITVAGTGRGKTVCGFYGAHRIGRKTLVVTTKDDIYRQWLEGAQAFLGLEPHEVGEIRQDKCEVIGTKFVVAMIHSLSKADKYPDWIREGFGLVIFDECHRVPAEQFQAVAGMFPARLRLALSATPERADGKELLVHAHIGPVRVRATAQLMVPKVLRFHTGWRCPRRRNRDGLVVRMPHEPGKTTFMEKILAQDHERNRMICSVVLAAYHKGRKGVLFSTLHDHLNLLLQALVQMGVKPQDVGLYIGASTKAAQAKRELVKVKPVILTTFTMMGEGTDIPWLDTCFLAMPRSRVEQPVGRVRREFPDKLEPTVVDFVDADSPVFAGYASSRLDWYGRLGAAVKDMH